MNRMLRAIDALSLRERLLVLAAGLALILGTADRFLVGPQWARQQALRERLEQLDGQLMALGPQARHLQPGGMAIDNDGPAARYRRLPNRTALLRLLHRLVADGPDVHATALEGGRSASQPRALAVAGLQRYQYRVDWTGSTRAILRRLQAVEGAGEAPVWSELRLQPRTGHGARAQLRFGLLIREANAGTRRRPTRHAR